MKNNKLIMILVISTSLIISGNVFAKPAQTFSNVFTFGGSFSTPIHGWAALITQHYGYKYVNNQTNFSLNGASTVSLDPELQTYKRNVKTFDPNALYLMYMGPNDANAINVALGEDIIALGGFNALINGATDLPRVTAEVALRARNIYAFVNDITGAGARDIIILNHFNEFYRQRIIAGDDKDEFFVGALLNKLFNQAIYSEINKFAPSANIMLMDYARLIEELSNNSSSFFTINELLNSYRDQGVFDTTSHPTEAAHSITAQYVLSAIESPSRIAYLREIPIAIGENIAQNIHSSSYDLIMDDYEKFSGDINGYYIGLSSKTQTPTKLGIKKSDTFEVAANLNYKIRDNLVVGLGINGDKSSMNFKNNNGKAAIKELLVTLNSTYRFNNSVFLYGSIGGGYIEYDIKRQIQLGKHRRIEQGKPNGVHYMATVGTGYQYDVLPMVNLIPFVNVNYQKVSMKSYTEKGEIRSTTMSFKIPDRKSVITEIGTIIDGGYDINEKFSVTPSLVLTYGHEFVDSRKKQAKARVADMQRQFEMPTYKTDKSYFGLNGELSAQQTNNIKYGIKAGVKLSKNTKLWSTGVFIKYSL